MNYSFLRHAWIVAITGLLAACGGGDDDPNNGWTCVGGCASEGVVAVDNSVRAERLAGAVAQAAFAAVPSGAYTGRVVTGLSGTATLSGHSTSTRGSCGTDCASLTQDTNVTAVFDGYRVQLGSDQEVTLTGTVSIVNTTYNHTTATTSSSGGSMTVKATSLVARDAITTGGQVWGESDTVTLSTSSPAGSNWSGTLKGSNGVTYSF